MGPHRRGLNGCAEPVRAGCVCFHVVRGQPRQISARLMECRGWARMEQRAMRLRGSFSLLVLIYLIVGIVVAWKHDYINLAVIKILASALLAVVLWFLILLGVNLHIH
ncbi:MAG TPA: hypothetical protein VKD26_07115 [Streptosporangiaceae bacterium]|nr:hypothetical protein [Streptosporangiaceae bacterium]